MLQHGVRFGHGRRGFLPFLKASAIDKPTMLRFAKA
jgi:hypothetical protein